MLRTSEYSVANRRYGHRRWLLIAIAAGSIAAHAALIGVAELLDEPPRPKLVVAPIGAGTGVVSSEPAGISCGAECMVEVDAGTVITLRAIKGEGSIFQGWGEGCEPVEGNVLACRVTVERSVRIEPRFGKIPEKVEIVFDEIKDPEEEDDEKKKKNAPVAVALPNPTAEFDKLKVPLPPPKPEAPKLELPKLEPPKIAQVEPPPPQIPRPQPPPPPPPPKPKQAPKQQPQMKAVEVPDENEVEKAPDDATHLSDKNRNVAEETRATDTNLEKQRKGENAASDKSDRKDPEVGADEEKIAQLDDVEETSFDARRVEEIETRGNRKEGIVPKGQAGDTGDEGDAGDGKKDNQKGVLAMRGIDGRGMPGGPVVDTERKGHAHGRQGKRGKKGHRGIKTQFDFDAYERIVGKEVAKQERELGRKRTSKRLGRYERKQKAVRAALENFIPEVRPGNQTALKTRQAPFAVYVARMHRRIHELWGFGFLDDLEKKSASDPLNDMKLHSVIEVAINADGSIHKTTIVRNSGVLMFDVAAIDALYTAAPFLETPEAIRSVDGRVYVHWTFRRDWEQCGTFNTRMFILDQISEGKRDDGEMVRNVKDALRKNKNGGAGTGDGGGDADSMAASARAHANMPAPDDPEAQRTANRWLTGLAQRDVAKMVAASGAPFSSGDHVIANSTAELGNVYRNILSETRGRPSDHKLMSPAGYRKTFGSLPPGVDVAAGNLLLAVRVGSERFTLVLKRTGSGSYEVVAFHR